jgi:hypothetical protein
MTPTCDGHTAANRTFFLDLTGFGSEPPNGGAQQALRNVTVGQQHAISADVETDGALPLVSIDGVAIALTAGTKGTDIWTPEKGTFTAQSASPVLAIQNQAAGQEIDFVDNVIVRAQ